uniref:Zinc transporter ZupT n=1 Tax=Aplanochytrium stocchinoi TaxID=215587 RepID=A0A7S3LMR0_9STRA
MSCLAGASTGIGALFVFLLDKDPSGSHLAFSLSLAAGVMLSVSVADMWIPLGERLFYYYLLGTCIDAVGILLVAQDGFLWPTFIALLGAITFQILEHFLPSQEDSVLLPTYTNAKRHDRKYNAERTRNFRLALVMMLTLTAHNFPEGLAVSVSNMKNESHGLVVTVAIAVHNIPEGLAIATPFFAATGNRFYSVMMAFLSGLSEPLGALVALTLLRPLFREYPWLVDYVLVFVAGVMTAVSFLELLPEARQYRKPKSVICGFVTGSIIMLLTMMYV